MTIMQEAAPIETTTCPAWCERRPEDHPDGERAMHAREVGGLGVAIECDDGGETVIYVPKLDRAMDDSASPAFARQLGADLIAAANLIDDQAVTA